MLIKLWLIRLLNRLNPQLAAQVAADLFASPQRIPRPEHENELIKTGERIILKCNLVAYRFGTHPGKPVLLVHGWDGRGTQLGFFVPPLVAQGYTVYALDGPGHGESPGTLINPALYAAFIKTVSLELGGLRAVIAHSFGAGSSVLAATNNMDVDKLVLIAGPDRYSKIVDNYSNLVKLAPQTKKLLIETVTARVGIHPEQMQVSMLAKKLDQKILVVHDKNDKSVSYESAERIHAAVPTAELLTTEGLGHRRILKDSKVIARVVDFVKT